VKLEIPLPGSIQVHNVNNYKGNPRTVLTIDGTQVLYRDGHVEDPDTWADIFRSAFARMFIHYLTEHEPAQLEWLREDNGWAEHTDREIDREQYDTIRLTQEGTGA